LTDNSYVTPPGSASGQLIPVEESPQEEVVPETPDVQESSPVAPSPDPIPVPPPVMPRPPPYPVRRGVQRSLRGRGTKSHPYEIDFIRKGPLRVSARNDRVGRSSVRHSSGVPVGNPPITDQSEPVVGSEQSVVGNRDDSVLDGVDVCRSRGLRDDSVSPASPRPSRPGIGWHGERFGYSGEWDPSTAEGWGQFLGGPGGRYGFRRKQ
jgi:hypothetical protein